MGRSDHQGGPGHGGRGHSLEAFGAALEAGTAALAEHAEKFDSDASEDAQYQVIPVSEARKLGILPLATRKESR